MNASPSSNAPVLVTGATGGLGLEICRRLAMRGRGLVVGGRRPDATRELANRLAREHDVHVRPFVADLADLDSVRAALVQLDGLPLHGIVTNAGITSMKSQRSAQGLEMTFAVNVLAHQLLLSRLSPQIEPGGRVVVVSSGVHEPDNRLARRAGVPEPRWVGAPHLFDPDQAPDELRLRDGRQRYSTSKLANVLQARGLQERLRAADAQVDVFAIDPGLMVDTNLARELPTPLRVVFRLLGRLATPRVDNMRLSTTSATHVESLLEDESWSGRGFSYLDGNRVKPPSEDAQNDAFVTDLWGTCERLLEGADAVG